MERKHLAPGLLLQPLIVTQLVGSVVARVVEGTGLTPTDFAVVTVLAAQETATPTRLAYELGMSPTTLSAALKRLDERGFLRRERDTSDGRRQVLHLTAKGQRVRAKALGQYPEWLARVRAELDGDPVEVLDAMRRLEAALRSVLD